MKKSLLLAMACLALLLSACAPTGRSWQTTQQIHTYAIGTSKVMNLPVPIPQWKITGTEALKGTDSTPTMPKVFDCQDTQPAQPQIGDQYCTYTVEYFIEYPAASIRTTKEEWEKFKP